MSAISCVASLMIFLPGDAGAFPLLATSAPTLLVPSSFPLCLFTYSSSLVCTSCRTLPGEASLRELPRPPSDPNELSLLSGGRCLAPRPLPASPLTLGAGLRAALGDGPADPAGVERPEEARELGLDPVREPGLDPVGVLVLDRFLLASSFARCSMT